jgi:aerobic carbon-monoxide dehydrogenase medium subunit
VKPTPFAYFAPSALDEALDILADRGREARVLAGGQSLIPLMNFRAVSPAALVDIGRIPGLDRIEAENGAIRIGCMVRQRAAEYAPLIGERLPLLREAIGWIGSLPVRSRGTICGSLAHADPAAELPMVMKVLDAEILARSATRSRTIAVEDFFRGAFVTTLAADEMIVALRVPAMRPGAGFAFQEFAQRRGAPTIAAVAVMLERAGARCTKARIAAAGVGPVPIRLFAPEGIVERSGPSDEAIEAASELAAEMVDPISDLHASADFRRHLTQVLVKRALCAARTTPER